MAESLKKKRKLITFSDVKLRIKETLDKAVNADEAYEAIAGDIANHFLPSNFLDTSSDLFKLEQIVCNLKQKVYRFHQKMKRDGKFVSKKPDEVFFTASQHSIFNSETSSQPTNTQGLLYISLFRKILPKSSL